MGQEEEEGGDGVREERAAEAQGAGGAQEAGADVGGMELEEAEACSRRSDGARADTIHQNKIAAQSIVVQNLVSGAGANIKRRRARCAVGIFDESVYSSRGPARSLGGDLGRVGVTINRNVCPRPLSLENAGF